MRVILQRAKDASVTVNESTVGKIDYGIVAFVGVTHDDTEKDADYLANKLAGLRIFPDEQGKMNDSLKDVSGKILSISQFTLYADTRKGRRPNYLEAADPDHAQSIYNYFNQKLREHEIDVETGEFGAEMQVKLTNSGPVTIILDSDNK